MLTEAPQKTSSSRGEPAPRILIGDDQPDVLEALRLLLKPEGYLIDTASSPPQLLRAMEMKDYDVVLMDLNYTRDTTSGEEGLDLLQRIHVADESLPVVVMTAWGSVNVAAEAMHAVSPRAGRPMVTVNAGGMAEGVFESELFGHMKGAFTDAKSDRVGRFELADGSTLFLDEIANVPLSQQQKLLRVLETGEFERLGSSKTRKADVRLISATNAALNAEVAEGRFRQDLLFRLHTLEIKLPPLRDRREDIPP